MKYMLILSQPIAFMKHRQTLSKHFVFRKYRALLLCCFAFVMYMPVQFKMLYLSECAQKSPCVCVCVWEREREREREREISTTSSRSSLMLPSKQFKYWTDWRWSYLVLSRKIIGEKKKLSKSLLQVINQMMSLALCQHVVSQAPQHLPRHKSLVMVALTTCQSTWPFLWFWPISDSTSTGSGVFKAGWHMPVWASHSTFHFLYQALVKIAHVVWLSPCG